MAIERFFATVNTRVRGSGIAVLDLTDDLRERAQAGAKLYHSIDGHFNQRGHLAVAEILTPVIASLLVP